MAISLFRQFVSNGTVLTQVFDGILEEKKIERAKTFKPPSDEISRSILTGSR